MVNSDIIELSENEYLLDLQYLNSILDNGFYIENKSVINNNLESVQDITTPVILIGTKHENSNLFYIQKIVFRCETDKKRAENTWGKNDKFECSSDLYKSQLLQGFLNTEYVYDYTIVYKGEDGVEVNVKTNISDSNYFKVIVEDKFGDKIKIPSWGIKIDNLTPVWSAFPSNIKDFNIKIFAINESYKLKIYLNDKLNIVEYIQKLK